MELAEFLHIVRDPAWSALIWFALSAALMYVARPAAHGVINSVCRGLYRLFSLSARAVLGGAKALSNRNRKVLLASGRTSAERGIERELERIHIIVQRDLSQYPNLHRRINEQLALIETDFANSSEVPPSPPGWTKAVEEVAKLPAKSDPMMIDILGDIHKSLVRAHHKTLHEYRTSNRQRHRLLKGLLPYWRNIQSGLDQVDKHVKSLLERSAAMSSRIADYKQIIRQPEHAARVLSMSAITQFLIASLVLLVAAGAAIVNFSLIAYPMQEIVGGHSTIANFHTADIAALVIILVQIAMGLFLMECLRVTRLFTIIATLPDKLRIRLGWIAFAILLSLAIIEASLAFVREMLLQNERASSVMLQRQTGTPTTGQFNWITTTAQTGLGFILPFALAFAAISLETFVHSLRIMLGFFVVGILHAISHSLRFSSSIVITTGQLCIQLYDLIICLPLWVERALRGKMRHGQPTFKGQQETRSHLEEHQ